MAEVGRRGEVVKSYNYQRIDEMVQPLIEMMRAEYPNDARLVIDSNSAQIQYVHTDMTFLETSLKPENAESEKLAKAVSEFYSKAREFVVPQNGFKIDGGGGDG